MSEANGEPRPTLREELAAASMEEVDEEARQAAMAAVLGAEDASRPNVGHGPVRDFTTDFDHTDPSWVADPFPIWDELRQKCPVAHSNRYGGVWLPTRHEDVAAIAYDTEHFTSRT